MSRHFSPYLALEKRHDLKLVVGGLDILGEIGHSLSLFGDGLLFQVSL